MPTFQDDLDFDRDNTFLDTDGHGFAVSGTHTSAATGDQTAIEIIPIELTYNIFDPLINTNFYVSADAVAMSVNDVITYQGAAFRVLNIKIEEGMYLVSGIRLEPEQ